MQFIRCAMALMAVVASGQILAAMPDGKHVRTTGDLVELCSANTDDPSYPAAMGFCLGYINATLDYHAALTESPKSKPMACVPLTVTREEIVVAFVDWSKHNAQDLGDVAPVHGVMRAVSLKWPCPGQ